MTMYVTFTGRHGSWKHLLQTPHRIQNLVQHYHSYAKIYVGGSTTCFCRKKRVKFRIFNVQFQKFSGPD